MDDARALRAGRCTCSTDATRFTAPATCTERLLVRGDARAILRAAAITVGRVARERLAGAGVAIAARAGTTRGACGTARSTRIEAVAGNALRSAETAAIAVGAIRDRDALPGSTGLAAPARLTRGAWLTTCRVARRENAAITVAAAGAVCVAAGGARRRPRVGLCRRPIRAGRHDQRENQTSPSICLHHPRVGGWAPMSQTARSICDRKFYPCVITSLDRGR